MKKLSLTRSPSLITPCTLCLALLLSWSGYQVQAQPGSPTRGAGAEQLLNMGRPQAPPPAAVAPANLMSCPKCQTKWTARKDDTARGAIKPTVWVGKHLCEGCETTITTAGVGRGKHSVAVHKCTTCGAPDGGCCSTGKTTVGAKRMN